MNIPQGTRTQPRLRCLSPQGISLTLYSDILPQVLNNATRILLLRCYGEPWGYTVDSHCQIKVAWIGGSAAAVERERERPRVPKQRDPLFKLTAGSPPLRVLESHSASPKPNFFHCIIEIMRRVVLKRLLCGCNGVTCQRSWLWAWLIVKAQELLLLFTGTRVPK